MGGSQAATRADIGGLHRETIDPDDYRGGFSVWSGTSFAAPYVAGRIAALLGMLGVRGAGDDAVAAAVQSVVGTLPPPGVD